MPFKGSKVEGEYDYIDNLGCHVLMELERVRVRGSSLITVGVIRLLETRASLCRLPKEKNEGMSWLLSEETDGNGLTGRSMRVDCLRCSGDPEGRATE